ncbi:hypothetical protein [Yinghuangia soli]|uniref:Uncharacterized protein n=1 Tax=Yinghuangia soli TaxID=2908204 RepID=A0AA41Q910_9ACTN|nr:hypothetical protein [Yinghuangia soli]MCF2533456.1 hypothetical protein [Yinghuangia soli]
MTRPRNRVIGMRGPHVAPGIPEDHEGSDDVAGTGYPPADAAESQAAHRDESRIAGEDGSPALDRAVGASGPEDGTTEPHDTETRELLTDAPPPNRRTAP